MTKLLIGAAAALAALPAVAWAAEAPTLNPANTSWLLTATALVLFMTLPGLAMFYGGLVRAKNLLSVLMHCFVIACLASVLWFVCAYSLAFGDGGAMNPYIGGLGKAFLSGVGVDALQGDVPETVFFMFQMTFAIITPALIVGAYPERIRFPAVFLFSGLWLLLVYVPVAHWVWGGGWLAKLGVMDFAGGLVVHLTAGASAIVLAIQLGRRRGFPNEVIAPHSPGMTMMGAGMLWVGWYGFNAGSALAANGSAAMAMTVTHISASAGALTWMATEWFKHGKPSLIGITTGAVAGLATITPASGFVGPGAALLFGILAGLVCYRATPIIKQKFKIDDSLDVMAVHGVGGTLGVLLTGVFVASSLGGVGLPEGVGMGGQVGVQLLGVAAVGIWSVGLTYIIAKVVDAAVGLRVSHEEEVEGLDITSHGERAYDL